MIKFTPIYENKIDLNDFKKLVKYTSWKNIVADDSPSFVSDVLLRVMIITAYNTKDEKILKDCGLYSLYLAEQKQYPLTEYESLFIETLHPLDATNILGHCDNIENNIRKNRLAYYNLKKEDESADVEKLNKKIKWYEKIKMYFASAPGELDDYNKRFFVCEKELAEKMKLEKVKSNVTQISNGLITTEETTEKPEKKFTAKKSKKEKQKQKIETQIKKLKIIRAELRAGKFEIYCPSCRAKVIPTHKRLLKLTGKKGDRTSVEGICPIHGKKLNRLVPTGIEVSDLMANAK